MTASNAPAARAALAAGATGATDVTGFGLLGHLAKMAAASGVDAEIDVAAVPLLPGVRELAEAGIVPGGTPPQPRLGGPDARRRRATARSTVLLLADAQTSGGLLFGAAPERARRPWRSWPRRGVRGGDRRGARRDGADHAALITERQDSGAGPAEPGVRHLTALDPRGRRQQRELVAGPAHELHRDGTARHSTGTTTAGSPARFQACVYGTRAAEVSIVDR